MFCCNEVLVRINVYVRVFICIIDRRSRLSLRCRQTRWYVLFSDQAWDSSVFHNRYTIRLLAFKAWQLRFDQLSFEYGIWMMRMLGDSSFFLRDCRTRRAFYNFLLSRKHLMGSIKLINHVFPRIRKHSVTNSEHLLSFIISFMIWKWQRFGGLKHLIWERVIASLLPSLSPFPWDTAEHRMCVCGGHT